MITARHEQTRVQRSRRRSVAGPRSTWTAVILLGSILTSCWLPALARAELRPLHDAAHGVRLVAEDFWLAATSPARMESRHWIRLGQILAVGGVLFAFDEDIDRAAQRNRHEPLVDGIDAFGAELDAFGLMGKTWPLYAGTMVVGYVSGVDRMKRIGGEILVAQWMSGALRNGFKLAVGRRRPNEGRGAYFFEFDGGTSLPSGHSSSVFAAAEILRLHAARWWVTVPLYTAATAVALQRVTSRQHWASDSWIGAVSGIAAARFVFGRHEPGTEGSDWTFVPTSLPDGRAGVGIVRRF